jgi:peroxiredoxin
VFILDRAGIIRYTEIVKEIAHEPDYEAAYKAIKALL